MWQVQYKFFTVNGPEWSDWLEFADENKAREEFGQLDHKNWPGYSRLLSPTGEVVG